MYEKSFKWKRSFLNAPVAALCAIQRWGFPLSTSDKKEAFTFSWLISQVGIFFCLWQLQKLAKMTARIRQLRKLFIWTLLSCQKLFYFLCCNKIETLSIPDSFWRNVLDVMHVMIWFMILNVVANIPWRDRMLRFRKRPLEDDDSGHRHLSTRVVVS